MTDNINTLINKSGELKGSVFNSLSQKHKLFIVAYLQNALNGTKAYLQVYPHVTKETAEVNSSRLLRNAKVKSAFDELITGLWEDKESFYELGKTLIAVREVAFSNIFDIVTIEKGNIKVKDEKDIPPQALLAVKSIDCTEKSTPNGIERKVSIRMHDKLAALELLARIQKMLDNKVDVPMSIVIKPAIRPQQDKLEE